MHQRDQRIRPLIPAAEKLCEEKPTVAGLIGEYSQLREIPEFEGGFVAEAATAIVEDQGIEYVAWMLESGRVSYITIPRIVGKDGGVFGLKPQDNLDTRITMLRGDSVELYVGEPRTDVKAFLEKPAALLGANKTDRDGEGGRPQEQNFLVPKGETWRLELRSAAMFVVSFSDPT